MDLTLGLEFDSGSWPGPLAASDAVAGERWVGPLGLLSVLEAQLGLGRPTRSATVRAATFVPAVREIEGFWSESADVDPLGVARELLYWRDTLRLHGWDGSPVGARRLDELSRVSARAEPGVPDRIAAVSEALEDQQADVARVTLSGVDRTVLPALWNRTLEQLESHGTVVRSVDSERVTGIDSDLGSCLEAGFDPRGDGTLQLVRPVGLLGAAEQVAAWLADQDDLCSTVVIGADEVLDDALHRAGVPTLGAGGQPGHDLVLQVLPLCLELAWAPQDPTTAQELLTLAVSPVPGAVRWRLLNALHEWPALGGSKWREALAAGLETIDDPARRGRTQERLRLLLEPATGDADVSGAEVRRRVEAIRAWHQGCMATAETERSRWAAAVSQCGTLLELLGSLGQESLTRPELHRLIADATSAAPQPHRHVGQAGLRLVGHPASVAGPARRVIWWNFTHDAAESARTLPLDTAEIDALASVGVHMPDLEAMARETARGWRSPFLQAIESLLLICPRVARDGREGHPHPIFDEVTARLSDEQLARIEVDEVIGLARTREHSLHPRPVSQTEWQLTTDPVERAGESMSPTSAGELLGCPLHWVLKRVGGISRGRTEPLPGGALLTGKLAHEIIDRVLSRLRQGDPLTPDQAAELAGRLFDEEGPDLATPFFLPGAEAERAAVRHMTVETCRDLVRHIEESGATVVGTEEWLDKEVIGRFSFCGRYDLRLREPDTVLDFKLGGANWRRDALSAGTAFQLATYARLAGRGRSTPAVGYYITRTQQLLTTAGAALRQGEVVDGPPVSAMWDAFLAALDARCDEMKTGTVTAPCELEKPPESDCIENGVLNVAPPCRYCEFGALCHGEATE